jgi:SAM-dependent methyltransferase
VRDESGDLGETRAFYHRFAWAYDRLIERPGGPQIDNVSMILRDHGCQAGARFVDAGCGTGAYAVALSKLGFLVTAVDRSAELLDVARRRARRSGATLRFARVDLSDDDWSPVAPADGVLCRGVLNDLLTDAAREGAFGSFARWLRPDGVLLLDVRDTERSRERYATGREFTSTATRNRDSLTFTSSTTMAPGSDRLELVERWQGHIDGERVTHEDRFEMRTWSWSTLQNLLQRAGFATISRLNGQTVGAGGDRIVALAIR